MQKKKMESLLNSFSWKYREIFIEDSLSYTINLVNWKIKTPKVNSLFWTSFLARSGNEEYFKVVSWKIENLEEDALSFAKEYSLNWEKNEISLTWEDEIVFNKDDVSSYLNEVVSWIEKAFKDVFEGKKIIKSSDITLAFSSKNFIVWNSNWKFGWDSVFYNTYFVRLVGQETDKIEEIFHKLTWVDIMWKFNYENFKKGLEVALETLENQLSAIPSPSGEMDVIIWNESGWTIIHEAVWHGLEADLQATSTYAWRIWEKVACENVTVVDDPNLANLRGFYSLDHEWNKPQKAVLIENWILKTYMHTNKTAEKFGLESTGHARRENYRYKTLVRMGTTYLAPWKDKKEDLIAKVEDWLYVSSMWGGQVNTATWDFVFQVQSWFRIKNWKLAERVRWATLSGSWPEMLNKIYWICDDLVEFDGWTCWKWQAMPVSDATATVLTRLKVSGQI